MTARQQGCGVGAVYLVGVQLVHLLGGVDSHRSAASHLQAQGGRAPLLVRVLTAEARLLLPILPTLKKSPLAPKAAVATAFASVDADRDNGVAVSY